MNINKINFTKLKKILKMNKSKSGKFLIKKNSKFYQKLFEIFYFCRTLRNIEYCIDNNIRESGNCCICNKPKKYFNNETCSSKKCSNNFLFHQLNIIIYKIV